MKILDCAHAWKTKKLFNYVRLVGKYAFFDAKVIFTHSLSHTKGSKKVTNLFQIGLFPHKKVKFAYFSTKQVCNVKKKTFQCLIHLLLIITRKYAIICVKWRSIVQRYIHVIESDLCANVRFFALMKVSSRCWSPFHANECVFSRNEQQKV